MRRPISDKKLAVVFKQIDQDGSGELEFEEFLEWWREEGDGAPPPSADEVDQRGEEAYAEYRERVGIANIFNPFSADLRYVLNLKKPDERAVAAVLVRMTDEPGENWLEETFNGMPFEMSIGWVTDGPPTLGTLELVFKTYPGTADAALRCELARRLLMPGRGRWRAVRPPRGSLSNCPKKKPLWVPSGCAAPCAAAAVADHRSQATGGAAESQEQLHRSTAPQLHS
jgi:hypothetical protein